MTTRTVITILYLLLFTIHLLAELITAHVKWLNGEFSITSQSSALYGGAPAISSRSYSRWFALFGPNISGANSGPTVHSLRLVGPAVKCTTNNAELSVKYQELSI